MRAVQALPFLLALVPDTAFSVVLQTDENQENPGVRVAGTGGTVNTVEQGSNSLDLSNMDNIEQDAEEATGLSFGVDTDSSIIEDHVIEFEDFDEEDVFDSDSYVAQSKVPMGETYRDYSPSQTVRLGMPYAVGDEKTFNRRILGSTVDIESSSLNSAATWMRYDVLTFDYGVRKTESDVMKSMDISGDVMADIMGGGVTASMSGSFMKEDRNYAEESVITVNLKFISGVHSLDPEKLRTDPTAYNRIKELGGTHFVREIIYGGHLTAQVTFTANSTKEALAIDAMGKAKIALDVIAAGNNGQARQQDTGEEPAEEETPVCDSSAEASESSRRRRKRSVWVTKPGFNFKDYSSANGDSINLQRTRRQTSGSSNSTSSSTSSASSSSSDCAPDADAEPEEPEDVTLGTFTEEDREALCSFDVSKGVDPEGNEITEDDPNFNQYDQNKIDITGCVQMHNEELNEAKNLRVSLSAWPGAVTAPYSLESLIRVIFMYPQFIENTKNSRGAAIGFILAPLYEIQPDDADQNYYMPSSIQTSMVLEMMNDIKVAELLFRHKSDMLDDFERATATRTSGVVVDGLMQRIIRVKIALIKAIRDSMATLRSPRMDLSAGTNAYFSTHGSDTVEGMGSTLPPCSPGPGRYTREVKKAFNIIEGCIGTPSPFCSWAGQCKLIDRPERDGNTCVGASAECECWNGYFGDHCQYNICKDSNPCGYDGICKLNRNREEGYDCECRNGMSKIDGVCQKTICEIPGNNLCSGNGKCFPRNKRVHLLDAFIGNITHQFDRLDSNGDGVWAT